MPIPPDKGLGMTTVTSVAGEAFFCTGWMAVGAAAACSRYKKALDLWEEARGPSVCGAEREYHNGLLFGRLRPPLRIHRQSQQEKHQVAHAEMVSGGE